MSLPTLMKRNMPDRAHTTGSYINFVQPIKESLNFGDSRSENLTLKTILLACMNNSYVEGSSQLTGISGQTVRNHLCNKNPEGLLQINADLIATMRKKGLFSKPLIVAIDWHDEMYYGDIETEGIIGTKNKAGTNYAYEYATASIVVEGIRFVIVVIPVRERTILSMVSMLLDIIESHGIRISSLLMDGGFYSIDLINYLNSTGMNFVMHAPKLGKECKGKEIDMEYRTSSHHKRKKDQASFRIVSIYGHSKRGTMLYVFATNMDISPKKLLKLYRKRWGIETGYRMIRKFLARTTSKKHDIRLLYFYLAILLYNMWVLLNLVSRVKTIADNMRVFIASKLIGANPFVTDLVRSNGHSGGDF
ncbi:MAG: transposase IS4 family protein [Ferroplasma sp. Type II]|uniref:transposase n=1 Tax=Ferroplasma sp. Type II TaxID=261388 RepID=UPI0003894566|nr:transposase [Ferroplasma sp. Type II]EQB73199.1 MAG: transposase IS4 family protein [Ferroplasma sp. Type II]